MLGEVVYIAAFRYHAAFAALLPSSPGMAFSPKVPFIVVTLTLARFKISQGHYFYILTH
jgi:hypothetical protein